MSNTRERPAWLPEQAGKAGLPPHEWMTREQIEWFIWYSESKDMPGHAELWRYQLSKLPPETGAP